VEIEQRQQSDDQRYLRFSLSWVAYIRPAIVFLLLSFLGLAFWGGYRAVAVAIVAFALVLLACQILSRRALALFTDEEGVWLFSGILPWNKGIAGVKWRDLEGAGFYPGMLSWAFNSYSIRVGHRFTKTSEIVIAHVRNGRQAVEHINSLHQQRLVD
jgi:hypothetical protein